MPLTPRVATLLLLASVCALSSASTSVEPSAFTITGQWVRAMPPTHGRTAAYGTLTNTGEHAMTITGGHVNFANSVELHTNIRSGDTVRMAPLPNPTLAPGEAITFKPGGDHLMLLGVRNMPKENSTVEICLDTDRGSVCFDAPVLRKSPSAAHHGNSHH